MRALSSSGWLRRGLRRGLCVALPVLVFAGCDKPTRITPRQGASMPASAAVSAAASAALSSLSGLSNLGAPANELSSAVKTVIAPHFVTPLEVASDVASKFEKSHNAFAFNLYRKLAATQPDGNFVYSPVSLQLALGLLVVGGRGGGENRLARVTAPGVKPDHIHEMMQSWQEQLLRSMNSPVQPGVERVGELKFTNSLWLDDSVQPNGAFVEKVGQFFGFGVFRAPLRSASNTGVIAINQWVGAQTDGRTTQLLRAVPTTDNAVILNGAYFKTKFASALDSVESEPFNARTGSKGSVDMLHAVAKIRAVQTLTYQAVELDLVYGALSLVVLMPMAGSLEGFVRGISPQKWAQVLSDLEHNKKTVDLHLPKSDLRSRFDNLQNVVGLGGDPMILPFVAPGCQVSSLSQESTFVLNKEGIEVPSAAGTTMQSGSGPSKEEGALTVRFDKPYIFAVTQRLTGAILYLGQVVAP